MRSTVKWFGESWGAGCCTPEDHIATPVGEPCIRCARPLMPGDIGISMPLATQEGVGVAHYHLGCSLESILGADHPAVKAELALQKHAAWGWS